MPVKKTIGTRKVLEEVKRPFLTMKKIVLLLCILLAVACGISFYFYSKLQSSEQKSSKETTAQTVEEVGKLMVLPADETPTLATVSDPEKLKDQPFFANAQVGDRVLIYTQAKKAILYRPSTKMIVEVSPLNN